MYEYIKKAGGISSSLWKLLSVIICIYQFSPAVTHLWVATHQLRTTV